MTKSPRQLGERFENENNILSIADKIFLCLAHGGSVLSNEDVWTNENLDILFERFVDTPDFSGNGFMDKLKGQLAGLSDGPIILFAEALLLDILPLANLKSETKHRLISEVLDLGSKKYTIPTDVVAAMAEGIFNGGMGFNLRRYFHLVVILELARFFRAKSPEEQKNVFADPWAWKELVFNAPGTEELSLRHSLLYLKHPETFLSIVSGAHKQDLIDYLFDKHVGIEKSTGDIDRDLQILDTTLIERTGHYPYYYDEPLVYEWLLDEGEEEELDPTGGEVEADGPKPYDLGNIMNEGCFHDPEQLKQLLAQWDSKKNLILQGAPGTGKTWLAKRLAYALIGAQDESKVKAVQFHPGTSYEDFVRGWRPQSSDGQAGQLQLVDGPLIQHAELARKDREGLPHVLLIEEINRGNPSQAFGELLTLIESTKRSADQGLELSYSADGARFHLPENFFIIGTMNVADRSLALVDFALRRRFAFATLRPQFGEAWQMHLIRLFPGQEIAVNKIKARIQQLNDEISQDTLLGNNFELGHSFFTPHQRPGMAIEWFKSVVESEIRPLLHEYWYDKPELASEKADAMIEGL